MSDELDVCPPSLHVAPSNPAVLAAAHVDLARPEPHEPTSQISHDRGLRSLLGRELDELTAAHDFAAPTAAAAIAASTSVMPVPSAAASVSGLYPTSARTHTYTTTKSAHAAQRIAAVASQRFTCGRWSCGRVVVTC